MTKKTTDVKIRSLDTVFSSKSTDTATIPIQFVSESNSDTSWQNSLSEHQRQWLNATRFKPKAGNYAAVPSQNGTIDRVIMGVGDGSAGNPSGPSALLLGKLARALPPEDYHLSSDISDEDGKNAALAWGLGSYQFDTFRSGKNKTDEERARLVLPAATNGDEIRNITEAVWFARDLINTPASQLGPEELERASRTLAEHHGADIKVITGDALEEQNFPLIHAVGRASPRAPRLIELNWKPAQETSSTQKTLTIIGKGICFDTGGLDLKPPANMLMMKKDMGGAATVMALAHMIMGQKLNVGLRVLIPAAENSVSGNAFRPSDVIAARDGTNVEIGNTDAEGRLVLADALAYSEERAADLTITCATLTGAARVALGADLPALFSTDDALAGRIVAAGLAVGDPVWQLPFWPGYKALLKSKVADINNIGSSPLGGAITAALFLKSFVKKTERYVHVDLYGWQPENKPMCPIGGEAQSARALLSAIKQEVLS